MSIRWRRVLLGALFVELIALAILAVVTAFGPQERDAAAAFAVTAGRWIAPVGGVVAAAGIGWWIARSIAFGGVLNASLVGTVAAAAYVGILVLGDASFDWLHVIGAVGRIGAAIAGGMMATRAGTAQAHSGEAGA